MGILQRVIMGASVLAAWMALRGIIVRKRHRSCYSFPFFLAIWSVGNTLMVAWPTFFYQRGFWLLCETMSYLLIFAVALELTLRTFRAFPGARATARRVVLVVLLITYATVVSVSVPSENLDSFYRAIVGKLNPQLLNGAIWLFTVISALILWYRLPVDRFHKAILMGFVPYLLVFAAGLRVLDTYGWEYKRYLDYGDPFAYLVVLTYWTYAAWKPAQAPVRAPEPLRELPHSA